MIKKSDFSSKVTEIEGKIPNISGLATKTELTAVENKIPSVSNLSKISKIADFEKKITDHVNKLIAKVFNERLKWSNSDIDINWKASIKK